MDLTQFSPSSALITVVILGIAPFIAVMITSFTKIVVVLSLLRNALGLQQVPPNLITNGLALVLSIYVMYPVGLAIHTKVNGYDNPLKDTGTILEVASQSKEPMRKFLSKHANAREREFFISSAGKMLAEREDASEISSDDFIILIPAFTISELTSAFQMGFLIFLPFIVIDLVVANVLMAMGMMMLSPTVISLPFKLLLFVLVDGWAKLAHGLVLSYL